MFVWECIKTEGKHLGTCVDGFLFGSCCGHNDTANAIESHPSSASGMPLSSTSTLNPWSSASYPNHHHHPPSSSSSTYRPPTTKPPMKPSYTPKPTTTTSTTTPKPTTKPPTTTSTTTSAPPSKSPVQSYPHKPWPTGGSHGN